MDEILHFLIFCALIFHGLPFHSDHTKYTVTTYVVAMHFKDLMLYYACKGQYRPRYCMCVYVWTKIHTINSMLIEFISLFSPSITKCINRHTVTFICLVCVCVGFFCQHIWIRSFDVDQWNQSSGKYRIEIMDLKCLRGNLTHIKRNRLNRSTIL